MGSRDSLMSDTVCPRATFKPIYASPTQLGDPGGPGKGCKDFSKNEKSENLKKTRHIFRLRFFKYLKIYFRRRNFFVFSLTPLPNMVCQELSPTRKVKDSIKGENFKPP